MTNQIDERREQLAHAIKESLEPLSVCGHPTDDDYNEDTQQFYVDGTIDLDKLAGLIVAEPTTDEEVREAVRYLRSIGDNMITEYGRKRALKISRLLERLAAALEVMEKENE